MLLITKISQSHRKFFQASAQQFVTAGLMMLFICSLCNLVQAEAPHQKSVTKTPEETNPKSFITKTPAKLMVHPDALLLATAFVEKTLPKLIGDDPALAAQLGFNASDLKSFKEFGVTLQDPYPVFIVALRDLFEFVQHPSNPVDLIKKDVNWIEGPGGTLIPARWLFPVELNENQGIPEVTPQTSVIIGKSPSARWRVHQVGGPNLVRAVKQWATKDTVSVLWIPGINRHYLGQVTPEGAVRLKVLFDDPLADVKAGKEFDPSDEKVINYLKYLDETLRIREKLRPNPMTQPLPAH